MLVPFSPYNIPSVKVNILLFSPISKFVKLLFLENAPVSIVVNESGKFNVVKLVQPSNADFFISTILSGNVILVKLLQFKKVYAEIYVRFFDNFTVSRLSQPLNTSPSHLCNTICHLYFF